MVPGERTKTFTTHARWVIPLLNLFTKRDWRGVENIPQSGAMIALSNHISYSDSLLFAHFLYGNGRAVRFLAKSSLFTVPVFGKILTSAEQIPVDRRSPDSTDRTRSIQHAIDALNKGYCLGMYPEGTITRDPAIWPMVAKTGVARLAVQSRVPVIPCAQWGAQEIWPPYTKFPRLYKRSTVVFIAGAPLDFSPWYGKEDDHQAMVEATRYAMDEITHLLEEIRGECAPEKIFDPHNSTLPKFGNFKKEK